MARQTYTTRLQKGGALLDEMRQLMLLWEGRPRRAEEIIEQNLLASPSRARSRDVVTRAFVPRFVRSKPQHLWRAVTVLERGGWSPEELRPIHLYATASAEPLLWDFVVEVLYDQYLSGRRSVSPSDVVRFVNEAPASRFPNGRWTETVATKVARGVLVALRDFGLLEGATKKQLVSPYVPTRSFAFVSFLRHSMGVRGAGMLSDACWKLFLFTETTVERFFIEAHQLGLLEYHAAGSVVRVEYPARKAEEYAHVLCH